MSKPKYKVGERRVLMVDHPDLGGCRPWDPEDSSQLIALGPDFCWIECNEDETFNDGDLIAAECINVIGDKDSVWKRIS